MNLSLQEILTQAFGFLVLLFVLKKMFWRPVLASLENRREKIKTDLDKIESAKQDAESLKAEYNRHLQKIDDEARVKIQEAIDEGRRISREMQDRARTESLATFEKSKENLQLEVAKARITLRREIADLAIGLTERVLQEKLGDAKQQEKIQDMIKEIEAAK